MSTNPQLDFHPDAESLCAFAEHQLPEHERQPILAHLAACAHCRQILFLAQDAKEPEQPATAGPVLLPSPKKTLANWRYAWGALAACATLATISVVLYPRHPASAPELAKVVTPRQTAPIPVAAPPAEDKKLPSQPLTANPQSNRAARPAAVPAPEPAPSLDSVTSVVVSPNPAAQPPAPKELANAGSSNTLNITLKPAQSSETVEVQAAAPPLTQSGTQSGAQTVDVTAENAQLQTATPPLTVTMSAQEVQSEDQLKLKSRKVQPLSAAHSAPKSPAASGGMGNGAVHGLAGSVRSEAAGRPAASPAAFAKMAPRQLTVSPEDETAAHNALGKILPSGLPAIATASASHHLLALDSAGALFLSEDAGAVWEPVSTQWTGRAVLVLAPQTAPNQASGLAIAGRAAAGQPSQGAAAPAAPPPALFEIVNDQGIHWTSGDGRIWKTK